MQRVKVQLEDDITGGPAEETVQFGMEGRAYEIDLNARHAAEFRRKLAPFVEHARLMHARRGRGTVRTAASRERSRQIRAWAKQRGLPLSPHGRLPHDIVQQYENEHGGEPTAGRRAPKAGSEPARVSRSKSKRSTSRRRAQYVHLTCRVRSTSPATSRCEAA
ncbi:MAG: Lsr2 family protein [Actinobacteria bacterium]|nr:Lsr2 family protein [Actinomycetota bacterium]